MDFYGKKKGKNVRNFFSYKHFYFVHNKIYNNIHLRVQYRNVGFYNNVRVEIGRSVLVLLSIKPGFIMMADGGKKKKKYYYIVCKTIKPHTFFGGVSVVVSDVWQRIQPDCQPMAVRQTTNRFIIFISWRKSKKKKNR